jgi:hypothetical protein
MARSFVEPHGGWQRTTNDFIKLDGYTSTTSLNSATHADAMTKGFRLDSLDDSDFLSKRRRSSEPKSVSRRLNCSFKSAPANLFATLVARVADFSSRGAPLEPHCDSFRHSQVLRLAHTHTGTHTGTDKLARAGNCSLSGTTATHVAHGQVQRQMWATGIMIATGSGPGRDRVGRSGLFKF